jgi:hypothetical protein
VVSDLEFFVLRNQVNYSHRRITAARAMSSDRDVNVPEDLSGTLVTQNHPGLQRCFSSQAEESARQLQV